MTRARVIGAWLGVMAGCAEDPRYLGDRIYVSESIEGRELVPGSSLQLHFGAEGELDAYAGCNNMWGSHELAGGRVVTPLYFGFTEKGCSTPAGDLHAQEDWFREFLEADPYYEIDDPRLVLSDDEVTVVFRIELPEPDRPLEGTSWTTSGFIRDGFVLVPQNSSGSLRFAGGELSIVTPCAMGTTAYAIEDQSLELGGSTLAIPVCPEEDEFAVRVDTDMREVLAQGVVDFEVLGDSLRVMRGDIGLWLRAE